MPDGLVDPHTDLRTGVLRNLVGAGTWDELRNAEGELVAMRMMVTSPCFSQNPMLTSAKRCAYCSALSARKIWFVGLSTANW